MLGIFLFYHPSLVCFFPSPTRSGCQNSARQPPVWISGQTTNRGGMEYVLLCKHDKPLNTSRQSTEEAEQRSGGGGQKLQLPGMSS
ncbi:hypothetical protein BJ166DRAFT_530097 [Pestalotiopsis sp. NC0098]|nr:hypothetical protein BJ166DRAFT_530097 [Pestalotiopsis sp. NC0098]